MTQTSNPDNANEALVLLTVTWAKDRSHFSLLRRSLENSQLKDIPHHVVVQHEDLALFKDFPNIILHSSADVLPDDVEQHRQRARIWQQRIGRRGTKIAGSLARKFNWPYWVRFTGWHTQQLSKLAFAAASNASTVIIMDSDLIVTPHASKQDFQSADNLLCYQRWQPKNKIGNKVKRWQETAHKLFGHSFTEAKTYDGYYDTPFVMHSSCVRALHNWLEQKHARPWWQTLIMQPPRGWSEFGIYKQFLRNELNQSIDWRDANLMGYLYDASDINQLTQAFKALLVDEQKHYITIHSQSSGRKSWSADDYMDAVITQLQESIVRQ